MRRHLFTARPAVPASAALPAARSAPSVQRRLLPWLILLLASCLPAQAADLGVTGTIKPQPCKFDMHNGGMLDYGVIPSGQHLQQSGMQLDHKRVRFDVTCEFPTRLSLRVTDNKAHLLHLPSSPLHDDAPVMASSGRMPPAAYAHRAIREERAARAAAEIRRIRDEGKFMIGAAQGSSIGDYQVEIVPATIQGTTSDGQLMEGIEIVHAAEGDKQWLRRGHLRLTPNGRHGFAARGTTVPVALSALAGELLVKAVVHKMNQAMTKDEIVLNGSATMEITYD